MSRELAPQVKRNWYSIVILGKHESPCVCQMLERSYCSTSTAVFDDVSLDSFVWCSYFWMYGHLPSKVTAFVPLRHFSYHQLAPQGPGFGLTILCFRACTVRCGHVASSVPVEWPLRAVCRSLGRLRGHLWTFSSLQASKVAVREWRLLYFLAILEHKASTQIGEGLTCASCMEVFSGS